MIRTAALALAFLSSFVFSVQATAQSQRQCIPHAAVEQALSNEYQEGVVGMGVGRGRAVQLFTSENGSFTIVEVNPLTRMACIIAAGEGWTAMDRILPKGDPS